MCQASFFVFKSGLQISTSVHEMINAFGFRQNNKAVVLSFAVGLALHFISFKDLEFQEMIYIKCNG